MIDCDFNAKHAHAYTHAHHLYNAENAHYVQFLHIAESGAMWGILHPLNAKDRPTFSLFL
jgi:hypothetical protein